VSPRTGRPKAENPKNIQIKFLADKNTLTDLEYCCQKLQANKSEILRMGIQRIKAEVEEK